MSYLALCMPSHSAPAELRTKACRLLAQDASWSQAGRTGDLLLWTGPGPTPTIRSLGDRGFAIGEIYSACDGRPWRVPGAPQMAAQNIIAELCSQAFGRYVAIFAGPEPEAFRDPSGGLDCLVWRIGPLTLVADDLEHVPGPLQPPRLSLDWNVIARFAASASLAFGELALEGVFGVTPGTSRSLTDPSQSRTYWTPASFVGARAPTRLDQLAETLAGRVDIAVKALLGEHERLMVEVSGGLDSGILAGSIARLGGLQDRIVGWLNHFADRAEGDERAYARSATEAIGATLTCAHLPVRALSERDFSALAGGARPAFNALVPVRDEDAAARMSMLGATGLVSGQGGDAVFYQMPSALILADELSAHGPRALGSPLALALARRLRRSVWSVIGQALDGDRTQVAGRTGSITTLPRQAARQAHPWISAAGKVGPAKSLQIVGLANAQVATRRCRIAQVGSLLYPLTAQPVVEFCLGLPAAVLTAGGRERGLARQAFADRLPSMILNRRKKGELTAFHAQTVAASLDFLRSHLLDGALADAGVLDRHRLEAALKPEQLLWRGEGSEILLAAALEAWVRHWQRYVPDSGQAGRRQFWAGGRR